MRGGSVSQHAVERTLGKLATDDEFRARFFENPGAATPEAGLPLSPIEFGGAVGLSRAAIARFSQSLDGRIRRLCPAGTPPRAARRKQGRSSGGAIRPRRGGRDMTSYPAAVHHSHRQTGQAGRPESPDDLLKAPTGAELRPHHIPDEEDLSCIVS